MNLPNSAILSLQSDLGVIDVNGGVQKWLDQSGCGNDAIATPGPTEPALEQNRINGKPAIRFGGPYLMTVPLTSSNEYSFFFVVKTDPTKGEFATMLGSNSIPGFRWALGVGGSNDAGSGWGGNGEINLGATDYIPVQTWKLVAYIKSANKWDIYCNGVFIRSVADSSTPTYSGDKSWVLGREVESVVNYELGGYLAQVVICEEALKNGQRKKVEKEIMAYWGL